MISVVLRGNLADFGGPFQFEAEHPWKVVSALTNQIAGLKRKLANGFYQLVYKRGDREIVLASDMLGMKLNGGELIIIPEAALSNGGGGKGKLIAGAVLLAAVALPGIGLAFAGADAAVIGTAYSAEAFSIAGFSVSYANIAGFAASMLLTGIYQTFLAPGPTKPTGTQDANASTIFSGPYNSASEGGCIPLVMGEFICASKIISSDLVTARV